MNIDALPMWTLFVGAILFVTLTVELGYGLGRIVSRRSEDEKESSVSAIAGSVLGLVALLLAFTFGMVADRYSARKGLVLDEANTIRTTYQRTDFLPEPDRTEAKGLLREYVADRVALAQSGKGVPESLSKAGQIQGRLWDMAVVNARKDMNSDVAALYIDSLNSMTELHGSRVAIAIQQRIPAFIWVVLAILTFFGLAATGYHTGIAGSKRSFASPVLAISFGMVVALIIALDRPGHVKVSQQPLIDLRDSMASGVARASPPH